MIMRNSSEFLFGVNTHKSQNIMTAITYKLVKKLQWETGVGTIDCYRALNETNGDLESAMKWLKDKGIWIPS